MRTPSDRPNPASPPRADHYLSVDLETFIARYEPRIRLDRTRLDDEIEDQPELYWHVGDRLALEKSRRDEAAGQIKVTEAEADERIREDNRAANIKITEDLIKRAIVGDEKVQEIKRRAARLEYAVERLEALKWGFQQRNDMLKELSQLHQSQSRMPGHVRDADAQHVRDVNAGRRAGLGT